MIEHPSTELGRLPEDVPLGNGELQLDAGSPRHRDRHVLQTLGDVGAQDLLVQKGRREVVEPGEVVGCHSGGVFEDLLPLPRLQLGRRGFIVIARLHRCSGQDLGLPHTYITTTGSRSVPTLTISAEREWPDRRLVVDCRMGIRGFAFWDTDGERAGVPPALCPHRCVRARCGSGTFRITEAGRLGD